MSDVENTAQSVETGKQRQYRTKTALTDLWPIPDTIASPSLRGYRFALTLTKPREKEPHIVPVGRDCELTYDHKTLTAACNGKVIDDGILAAIQRTDIDGIDMITLRLLFSIFWEGVRDAFDKKPYKLECTKLPVVKVYIPDLLKKMGKARNPGKSGAQALLDKFQEYSYLVGIVIVDKGGREYTNYYPAITWTAIEEETNTVSYTSPYFVKILNCIMNESMIRDERGLPRLEQSGRPKRKISFHYLMDDTITEERNKRAIEIADVICQVIAVGGKSGHSLPHISAATILSRCPQLQEALNEPEVTRDADGTVVGEKPRSTSHKNLILKRAFTKALELLSSKTHLEETYPGIKLPDPMDCQNIPTMATLQTTVYEFPHDGSKKRSGSKGR